MRIRSTYNTPLGALFVTCIILFPQILSAAITLPLNGYCKTGRFFPVLVDGSDATHATLLCGDGCMSTVIDPQPTSRTIAPMLVTGSPTNINGTLSLQITGDNERLIGLIGADTSVIAPLFPESRSVPIHLLAADVFASPPATWETLDAIVFDPSSFSQATDEQRSAWLSAGIKLAVKGEESPDKHWPWRRVDDLWVLEFNPAGPTRELISQSAYSPISAWNPGWSTQVRLRALGIALLILLGTCALLLLNNRLALMAVFGLEILAAIGVASWHHSLQKIDRVGGGIYLNRNKLTQHDAWVFERAKESSTPTVSFTGWTHPIFTSATRLNQSQMTIHESTEGDLQYVYDAKPNQLMAFVRRQVQPGSSSKVTGKTDSPLRDLAKSYYAANGDQIVGEINGPKGRWADVVIDGK